MTNENKLHKWEEENKDLCFVNKQKNLEVYNLGTDEDDTICSGTRLYQADDVNTIIENIFKGFEEIMKNNIK